jgi:RNA polymerase sigma factor (sigma-70 family)
MKSGTEYEGLVKTLSRQHAEKVGRLDLLEDLEQEARLAAFQSVQTFSSSNFEQTETSKKNWACFKMRDALRDFLAKNIDETFSLDEPVSVEGESLTHHEVIGVQATQEAGTQHVEQASRLSPEAQQIATLHAQGLSFAEIAKALNKSHDAVRQTMSRAQRKLREVA